MAKKADQTSLKAFKADLKNKTPRRLYILHGEERYLLEHYFDLLHAQLLPDGAEAFNFKSLEGKTASARDITAACDCFPMMAERTLVVVKDYDLFKLSDGDKTALLEYFADLPEYLCLVFLYDLVPYKPDGRSKMAAAIKQYGLAVEFPRQEQGDLVDWVIRHAKAAGRELDRRDADYLVFYCGDLMHNLHGEIAKVAAYAKNRRITREDILAVATPQPDAVVFHLTDALAAKDYDKALGKLAELLGMQEPPQMILAWIGKYFRQLYAARVALESRRGQGELAELWKLKEYPAAKLMAAAQRVDLAWCRRALDKTAQTDLAMKSGGEDTAALTALILELAHG